MVQPEVQPDAPMPGGWPAGREHVKAKLGCPVDGRTDDDALPAFRCGRIPLDRGPSQAASEAHMKPAADVEVGKRQSDDLMTDMDIGSGGGPMEGHPPRRILPVVGPHAAGRCRPCDFGAFGMAVDEGPHRHPVRHQESATQADAPMPAVPIAKGPVRCGGLPRAGHRRQQDRHQQAGGRGQPRQEGKGRMGHRAKGAA